MQYHPIVRRKLSGSCSSFLPVFSIPQSATALRRRAGLKTNQGPLGRCAPSLGLEYIYYSSMCSYIYVRYICICMSSIWCGRWLECCVGLRWDWFGWYPPTTTTSSSTTTTIYNREIIIYYIYTSRPRVEFGILSLTSFFSVGILILKERIECYSFQRLCWYKGR